MKRLILLFILLMPLAIAADSEPPVINAFDVSPTALGNLLVTWTIDDNAGLESYYIYRNGDLLHHKKITGIHLTDLFQDTTYSTGSDYDYKLIVFDQSNNSVEKTIALSSDTNAPEIISNLEVITNKKILDMKTDEDAVCMFGYTTSDIILIDENLKKEHKVTLALVTEGQNLIYIKCEDEFNNKMHSFKVIEFEYDITDPTKVSNANYSTRDGKVYLNWEEADDENGIAQYNIYDDQDNVIDSTSSKLWIDSNKDRTRYYITAVDAAGNEGGKTRIDVVRDDVVVDDDEEDVVDDEEDVVDDDEDVEEDESDEDKTPTIVKVTIISWIVFGVLLVGFIAWKLYEGRADRHGLKSYMSRRRRTRNFRVRFKI